MVQSLKKLPIFLIILVTICMSFKHSKSHCDNITVAPRDQYVQIKQPGCQWIWIEYNTTDWTCRNGDCKEIGSTWHNVKIDTRGKNNIFYYEAARGPKNVSYVKEANLLDCGCQ
jgi:hypothetical protein